MIISLATCPSDRFFFLCLNIIKPFYLRAFMQETSRSYMVSASDLCTLLVLHKLRALYFYSRRLSFYICMARSHNMQRSIQQDPNRFGITRPFWPCRTCCTNDPVSRSEIPRSLIHVCTCALDHLQTPFETSLPLCTRFWGVWIRCCCRGGLYLLFLVWDTKLHDNHCAHINLSHGVVHRVASSSNPQHQQWPEQFWSWIQDWPSTT